MIRTKLSNHLRDVRKNEGGFTLIELLIVIVVLGILAGIVVFGVGTFRQDATAAACKADAKSVSVTRFWRAAIPRANSWTTTAMLNAVKAMVKKE